VKLDLLAKEYPENSSAFNILYLVSSAVPDFPGELVEWAHSRQARVVWNQNGVAYPAWAGPSCQEINAGLSRLLHRSDFIVYQSEFCRSSADHFLGRPDQPSRVIYNSVDTERFSPVGAQELKAETSEWVLLAAGSHQQPERVMRTLEVIAELNRGDKRARLVLAGRLDWSGADEQVRRAIGALGIEGDVEWVGHYSQQDAPKLYRSAHVLLHTKYKDPCPTVVIEAMSCGLPVVGSRSGGMAELVGDDAGILAAVPDSWDQMYYPSAVDLAAAIKRIMEDYPQWSAAARRRALERFSSEQFLEYHRQVFEQVVSA